MCVISVLQSLAKQATANSRLNRIGESLKLIEWLDVVTVARS